MPLYHCSVKALNRRHVRTATAAVAYRAGAKIKDVDKINDYTKKRGVIHTEIILPEGAPEWGNDREKLWNNIDAAEKRKNSTLAREYELALPIEVNDAERLKLAREFTKYIVEQYGVAADFAIHDQRHGNKNYHVHVMTSTRVLTPEGFTKKTRILDGQKTGSAQIRMIRKEWEKMVNHTLEVNGVVGRVTSDSFNRQGIHNREPTTHLGPNVLAILERQEQLKAAGVEDEKLVASTVADRILAQIEEHRAWNIERLKVAETIKAEHDRMYEEFMKDVAALNAQPASEASSAEIGRNMEADEPERQELQSVSPMPEAQPVDLDDAATSPATSLEPEETSAPVVESELFPADLFDEPRASEATLETDAPISESDLMESWCLQAEAEAERREQQRLQTEAEAERREQQRLQTEAEAERREQQRLQAEALRWLWSHRHGRQQTISRLLQDLASCWRSNQRKRIESAEVERDRVEQDEGPEIGR